MNLHEDVVSPRVYGVFILPLLLNLNPGSFLLPDVRIFLAPGIATSLLCRIPLRVGEWIPNAFGACDAYLNQGIECQNLFLDQNLDQNPSPRSRSRSRSRSKSVDDSKENGRSSRRRRSRIMKILLLPSLPLRVSDTIARTDDDN
ncbi:GBE1 [Lepeophtheirus salmonis]|uniref:GBE1 n=1 Tax=Lepeophtheirus salmonis TaxID=72036 RepID=A0A7R8CMI8_LEPSM|nr:GBE1 [Lepeophtheirus salmonis]CAF2866930.1 GBE1 [Lepeophtheirus salmonis]